MIYCGDALTVLRTLPDESVQCCVTSPPYWGLRDYGVAGQLGLETTPDEYVDRLTEIFAEVRRVLKSDGICWLNLGDTYAGSWGAMSYANGDIAHRRFGGDGDKVARPVSSRLSGVLKPKDLCMIPARAAMSMQAEGWYLRCDVIWDKPNPMPESVTDRPTKSHEYIFLLAKSERYYFDAEAIREPATEASLARWNQEVGNQEGSHRVPGKTNGTMKAVGGPYRKELLETQANLSIYRDKQRGHSRRHAGFNDRWDHMTKEEQAAMGRNKRSVWHVATQPFSEAHFATFPPKLIEPCILAGSKPGDTILDPFAGAGTTMLVAKQLGRESIGIELNPAYITMIEKRLDGQTEALPL